ncbi:RING-H2 finger protein ATL79-like [Panicum virgatum]|nr:RING-H2 finger protein ATL79-like [Panicum virgatum]
MEARQHYSRPLLLLQLQGPAASPASAPSTAGGAVPDEARSVPAPDAFDVLNANAILVLALLVCGLIAALALRAVLQCALSACQFHSGGAGGAPEQLDDPGRGGKEQQHRPPRRATKLVRALPWLAYSAGLARELAGSSRSDCAICLAAFARGEAVRVLPRCGHGFHARCVDRWLAARPTCPTCRQAPFDQTTALLQPADGPGPAVVVPLPLVRVVVVGDRVARLVEP